MKRGEKTKAEFVKIAAYAEDRGNPGRETFSYGEGLAGQCALEKESRVITDVPENYSLISTGLGEAKPRSILIAPVIYEEEVLAVLELASGSFNEFHAIICRNVMIYFDQNLQKKVLRLFDESLTNRGFLGLGHKETVWTVDTEGKYEVFDRDEKIY